MNVTLMKQLKQLNECLNQDILLGGKNCFNEQELQLVNAQANLIALVWEKEWLGLF